MNPQIENMKEDNDVLTFTLKGVNVSLANALRRTVMSDIPTVVFKTSPYEENKATIFTNTTRLNNEIIKQRLSCIPIHIDNLNIPIKNYLLELDVENLTDTMMFVTTQNFKIKNLEKGTYLSEQDTRNIFPANDQTGYFIDFVRLRPRISDEIPGEKIHLTCEFSIGTCKEDGMFNVVSACSYGCTIDAVKQEKELDRKRQEWKDAGQKGEDIAYAAKDWKLLDGQRVILPDSFDFIVQTVGVFTNQDILHTACDILCKKLVDINTLAKTDKLEIHVSQNTMSNCYDIILENEDYTIGKTIEYFMFAKFFEGLKTVSYCGFKKMHPHDTHSIIRVAYKESVERDTIKQNLEICIEEALKVFKKIKRDI